MALLRKKTGAVEKVPRVLPEEALEIYEPEVQESEHEDTSVAFKEEPVSLESRQRLLKMLLETGTDAVKLLEESESREIVRSRAVGAVADIVGSEQMKKELMAQATTAQQARDAAIAYDERTSPFLNGDLVEITHMRGGYANESKGDSRDAFYCDGDFEENVMQATAAAIEWQDKAVRDGLPVRIAVAGGDIKIVECEVGDSKRVGVSGPALESAEKAQALAMIDGKPAIAFTPDVWSVVEPRLQAGYQAVTVEDPQKGEVVVATGLRLTVPAEVYRTENIEALPPEELEARIERERQYVDPDTFKTLEHASRTSDIPPRRAGYVATGWFSSDDLQATAKALSEVVGEHNVKVDKIYGSAIMVNGSPKDLVGMALEVNQILKDEGRPHTIGMGSSDDRAFLLGRSVVGEGVDRSSRIFHYNNPGNCVVVDDVMLKMLGGYEVKATALDPVEAKGGVVLERSIINDIEKIHGLPEGKKFIGFESQLEQVKDNYRRPGTTTFILSEEATGKSVLVAEALHQLEKDGVPIAKALVEDYDYRQAYGVFTHLWEDALDIKGVQGEERQAMVDDYMESRLPELADYKAILNTLLGTKFEETEKTMSLKEYPEEYNRQIAVMTARMAEALAEGEKHTAVVIDNANFADEFSKKLLDYFAEETEKRNLSVIMTGRPQTLFQKPFDLKPRESIERMELAPLPYFKGNIEEASRNGGLQSWMETEEGKVWIEVINNAITLDPDQIRGLDDPDSLRTQALTKVAATISQLSRGRIAHGEELAKLVAEMGVFKAEEKEVDHEFKKVWRVVKADMDIGKLKPLKNMEQLAQQRLERISPEVRDVVEIAAVDGRVFTRHMLRAMIDPEVTDAQLDGYLAEILEQGLVREAGDHYEMPSHIQAAAYNSWAERPEVRAEWHRKLYYYHKEFSPDNKEVRQRHARWSDDYLQAIEEFRADAKEQKDNRMYAVSIAQTQMAHEALVALLANENRTYDGEAGRMVRLADEYVRDLVVQDVKDIMEAIEPALVVMRSRGKARELVGLVDSSVEPVLAAEPASSEAGMLLTSVLIERARQATWDEKTLLQAPELLMEAENRMRVAKNDDLSYQLSLVKGFLSQETGDSELAVTYFEDAANTASATIKYVEAKNHLAVLYNNGYKFEEAEQILKDIIEVAKSEHLLSQEVTYRSNLGEVLNGSGRREEAEAMYQDTYELAKSHGITSAMLYARGNIAFIYRSQDRFAEAQDIFSEVGEAFRSRGYDDQYLSVRAEEAFCAIGDGQYEVAQAIISSLEQAEYGGRTNTLKALLTLREGNLEEARKLFAQGQEELLDSDALDQSDLAHDSYRFGKFLLSTDPELARQYLRFAYDLYTKIGERSELRDIESLLS